MSEFKNYCDDMKDPGLVARMFGLEDEALAVLKNDNEEELHPDVKGYDKIEAETKANDVLKFDPAPEQTEAMRKLLER